MTNTATTPAPRKSRKKFFLIIVVLTALALDYYKFHFVLGKDKAVAESAVVVASTGTNVAVGDSVAKADTTRK